MIGRNDLCFCGSGKKWKRCCAPLEPAATPFSQLQRRYLQQYRIHLKDPEQQAAIRRACHLSAKILDQLADRCIAGVTTQELDDLAMRLCRQAGAKPASLGYGDPPFPKSICTSINEVICHGIPGPRVIRDGDIVNIDFAAILDGYYGDCSKMVLVGDVPKERLHVAKISYDSLMLAIDLLKPGIPLSLIGTTIEKYANAHGCSAVHQFVAHGVGLRYHEAPQIPHYANRVTTPLAAGMIFTIEPMINNGLPEAVIDEKDHWTATTIDGLDSAQWEHTLLITEKGYEILTPWTPPLFPNYTL